MTALPGGAADKLGNRYEHWVTSLYVAALLEGDAQRLRLERPGLGGLGAEFEVDLAGRTLAVQVKNVPSVGNWTITALARKGVLAAAKWHISQARGFEFYTSTPATDLHTLVLRARASVDYEEFSGMIVKDLDGELELLQKNWDCTPEEARSWLQGVSVTHQPEGSLRALVEQRYRFLFEDDPAVVLSAVRSFCDDHLHEEGIAAPAVWRFFQDRGLRRRLLAGSRSALDELRATAGRLEKRLRSSEPAAGLAPSPHLSDVLALLRDRDAGQIVVLEGGAGSGKSTVAAAAVGALEQEGWYVAVARMDVVDGNVLTAEQLGAQMGLSTSPAIQLTGVSNGQPALLVIDQLDAVSLYSGRLGEVFESVSDVVDQTAGHLNVKVLLVARTVDLEMDARLANMAAGPGVRKVRLGSLSTEAVSAYLLAAGIGVPDSGTLQLLRTPLHLALYTRLSDQTVGNISSLQDLYDAYTKEARHRLRGRVDAEAWHSAVESLLEWMNARESLSAPERVLDHLDPSAIAGLLSEQIRSHDQGRFSFVHETYFDYLFARAFVNREDDLVDFLTSGSQALFRRAQVRQVLEYVRTTDVEKYRYEIGGFLASSEVRAHVKQVALSTLNAHHPNVQDVRQLLPWIWDNTHVGRQLRHLLSGSEWFRAVDTLGLWREWLAAPDLADDTFEILQLAAATHPGRVNELLSPHTEVLREGGPGASAWARRWWTLLNYELRDELAETFIDLLRSGALGADADHAQREGDLGPVFGLRADDDVTTSIRILGAFLDRALTKTRTAGDDDPFKAGHLDERRYHGDQVKEWAATEPHAFLEATAEFVAQLAHTGAEDLFPDEYPPGYRFRFRYRSDNPDMPTSLLGGVDTALRELAKSDASAAQEVLDRMVEHGGENQSLMFLRCRVFTVTGPADDALAWVTADPRRLRLGWSDSPRWASRLLIERWAPHASTTRFIHAERNLLGYVPLVEKSPKAYRPTRLRGGWPTLWGRGQYELLSVLPSDRMSHDANRRLTELERKFGLPAATPPRSITAEFVGPPIPHDSAARMRDQDWLRALRKHNDERAWTREGKMVGGARELAQVLGNLTADNPERFGKLALTFDDTIPSAAAAAALSGIKGPAHLPLLLDVMEHSATIFGDDVARAVCAAVEQFATADPRLIALVKMYAHTPDLRAIFNVPVQDNEDVEPDATGTDQTTRGVDMFSAGMNTTRGAAALAAAHLLRRDTSATSMLMPTIEALVRDESVPVRFCAAEVVGVLLNADPIGALPLLSDLLTTTPELLTERTGEQLLNFALSRDGDTFTPHLAAALNQSSPTGIAAGHIWAMTYRRGRLPSNLPQTVTGLSPTARAGAAEVFAYNADTELPQILILLDDDDPDVRVKAAEVFRVDEHMNLNQLDHLCHEIVRVRVFDEVADAVVTMLDQRPGLLPESALAVCEKAIQASNPGTDPDVPNSGIPRRRNDHLVRQVVLQIYRTATGSRRAQCLDLIDILIERSRYGFGADLDRER